MTYVPTNHRDGSTPHPHTKHSTVSCFFHIQVTQPFLIHTGKHKIFSLVYVTVHSLLSSFAGLHQRHSSALVQLRRRFSTFLMERISSCPHNCHPLEKHSKVHRFSITLAASLFYVFTTVKQSCKVHSPSFNFSYVT